MPPALKVCTGGTNVASPPAKPLHRELPNATEKHATTLGRETEVL